MDANLQPIKEIHLGQHYMQSPVWAGVKAGFSWRSEMFKEDFFGADYSIGYKRTVPGFGKLYYFPGLNGITAANADEFTKYINKQCDDGFAAKLELYQNSDQQLINKLETLGWKKAKHIQYRHTVAINLTVDEAEIFSSFKSRCRNEIRKAVNLGVEIIEVNPTNDNLQHMYDLMMMTSKRKDFYIRDRAFTFAYWESFTDAGALHLYFAKYKKEVLAGAVVLTNKTTAWYKDGGSVPSKGNLMGPRLMQWEIMKKLKKQGINLYDLSGIPADGDNPSSPMRGIYTFKTGYARETVELMPTLELPLKKSYSMWPKAEKQWLRIYNLFARNLWY